MGPGVGNGDPSSYEADKCLPGQWQRKLFNGKCELILQAGIETGSITVEGGADGLQTTSAIIQIKMK